MEAVGNTGLKASSSAVKPVRVDVLIIGAGASGLMCAIEAGKRGRSVLILDHARKLAEKIRISGGGRCNFSNLDINASHYLSQNPHFCRSALARYTPQHFLDLLQKHGLHFSEKTQGQLFCEEGSEAIIEMLKEDSLASGVKLQLSCKIETISMLYGADADNVHEAARFSILSSHGEYLASSLVIATGGLSIPKIGATSFGYKVAEQFVIPMTSLKAGLVPLTFPQEQWAGYAELAGVSLLAEVRCDKQVFRENILFTHRGLSGPAILQISSYWQQGLPLHINLLPENDMAQIFISHHSSRMLLDNFLSQYFPKRFSEVWCRQWGSNKPLNQYSEKSLIEFASALHNWQLTPSGTLGYSKAEVTCGGVDTRAISSKTMQAKDVPGLFFIGEVLDVTGHLGGYNLHWAWASGYAAGSAV